MTVHAKIRLSARYAFSAEVERAARVSALAEFGLGYPTSAYEYAARANAMDPGNPEYAALLQRLNRQRADYAERSDAYGRGQESSGLLRWCLRSAFLTFIVNLFCGRGCCC